MNKLTLATVFLAGVIAPHAAAADVSFDNNCNISLEGEIRFYQGELEVEMENGNTMTIDPDRRLAINGKRANITPQQQQWVSDYYQSIDTAIPMALGIAHEGVQIARVAVTEVFAELLGNDDATIDKFHTMFDDLSDEMAAQFYDSQGNIKIDSTQHNDWFGPKWENKFEQQIETLVSESMGSILVAVGMQMMSGGGDMDAFEQRMERFGETIDDRVEGQAAVLESKAEALCDVLEKADEAENNMRKNIAGLNHLNLLEIKDRK